MANPDESRDTSRENPDCAIGQLQSPVSTASKSSSELAIEAIERVADAFAISVDGFYRPGRGPRPEGRARLVAIEALVRFGGVTPWNASKAFNLDLSTIKNALARAPVIASQNADYAHKRNKALKAIAQAWGVRVDG